MTPKIKDLQRFTDLREDQIIILPVVPPSQRDTYHSWDVVKTVPNEWETIASGLPTYNSADIIRKIIAVFRGGVK